MRFEKILFAGLVATGFALSASAAFAQPAGTIVVPDDSNPLATANPEGGVTVDPNAVPVVPADQRRPEDNWLKVCDNLETGERACIMRQLILKGGQFQGSFVLRDDPGQENRLLAVAAVPIGVLLPFGLTWQIDGSRPLRVPYMVCDPRSCVSQLVINEAYVSSLKAGAKLLLTARNRQNQDMVIEINLTGFTAVWDSETALTIDEFQAQETGQNALEQLLNQRAEEIRQEREQAGGGTPPPETPPAQ